MTPKVSVIVPVYNTEKYLAKCLDSLISQTLKDIEIICVDDCSSDKSLEVLKKYADGDDRIKVIDFKENKGVSAARNAGLDFAQGEYVGFVDSDDYVASDFYEKLYHKAKDTRSDVVKGNIYTSYADSSEELTSFYDMNSDIRQNKAYFYYGFTSAIYERSLIQEHNIKFPEGITHFEDPYFSIKVSVFLKHINFVDCAKYYYVKRSDSSCSDSFIPQKVTDMAKSVMMIFDFLNETNPPQEDYYIYINFLLQRLQKWSQNRDIGQQSREEIVKLHHRIVNYVEPKILSEYKCADVLNENRQNPLVKIFVSYIKPSFFYKSDILTPIHLGRAVAKQFSKEGEISDEDLAVLHENCIGDDDFEGNISAFNRRVGFLTGTYKAWKNYDKIGNPEYFGSFGYRKLLPAVCLENIQKYDLILPRLTKVEPSVKEHLTRLHGDRLYKALEEVLEVFHPDLLKEAQDYFSGQFAYSHELYVAKKEVFFDYCRWIFPILEYLLNLNFDKYEQDVLNRTIIKFEAKGEIRDVAYIIERITGFYFYHLTRTTNLKFKEYEAIIMLSVDKQAPIGGKDLMLTALRNRVKRDQKKNNPEQNIVGGIKNG